MGNSAALGSAHRQGTFAGAGSRLLYYQAWRPLEARQLRAAAKQYKVATQMGNQGYSNEGTRQCAEIVWNGDIGNVSEVHAWSDRPLWPQGLTEIPKPEPVPEAPVVDLMEALKRSVEEAKGRTTTAAASKRKAAPKSGSSSCRKS